MQWSNCSKLPTAMWGAYATVINSILYITGGYYHNDSSNHHIVYQYQLDEDQWSILPPLQQYCGIPVNINNHLTVISGKLCTTNKATNLVTTYIHNSWTNTYPNLSVARCLPAVVPYHQYVIVAGGKGDDDTLLDSIEIYDITKSHWMIVNTHLPEPMYDISATTCGDSFTIVGYNVSNHKRYRETYNIYIDEIISKEETQQSLTSSTDKDNTKWHHLGRAPFWRTALVPNASPPVIIGGNDRQVNTVNNITIYDDKSNSWKKISSLPINCAYTTVEVINQCIIVLGGASDTKTFETFNATALSDVIIGQLVLCD